VPTDARIVYGSGRLLGLLVEENPVRDDCIVSDGAALLAAALTGSSTAAAQLLALGEFSAVSHPEVRVLGYAETATGLGHCVASALGARYVHSTRRVVGGIASSGGFEEEHSHATGHLLLPDDPTLLSGGAVLVLVDDELVDGQDRN